MAKTRPTLNPALRAFWASPARNRVLYGGRSSSKSWDAAGFAVFLAANYCVRFLCARQFQNKISESVHTLLKLQIARFGLSHEFQVTQTAIRHRRTGSEFLFYGLWRHIDEIKSLESIDICWIEEAHNLTAEQWEVLEPTLRGEGSQFWIVFNPRLASDFVYRRFVTHTPPRTVRRQINYDENPFLSRTILRVIDAKRAEDEEDFRHIYLGEPREDDDTVIIRRSWVRAAIDAHRRLGLEAVGARRVGFDVADSGADLNACVVAHGFVCVAVDEWKAFEDELLKSAGRVHAVARDHGASITYDSIGVGAFAGAHFQALNHELGAGVGWDGFNAGSGVVNPEASIDPRDPNAKANKDFYANLKAQAWWEVARRFRNTFNYVERGVVCAPDEMIAIDSGVAQIDRLIDELCTPRRDFDAAGRAKVESKKDLARRDVRSPNLADAFIMAFAPREARSAYNFQGV